MKSHSLKPFVFFRAINYKNCIYIGAFLGAAVACVSILFIGALKEPITILPDYTFLMSAPIILFFIILGAFAGSLVGALIGVITLD